LISPERQQNGSFFVPLALSCSFQFSGKGFKPQKKMNEEGIRRLRNEPGFHPANACSKINHAHGT
jgi:hypothetical protein